jgi:hypothetical protein
MWINTTDIKDDPSYLNYLNGLKDPSYLNGLKELISRPFAVGITPTRKQKQLLSRLDKNLASFGFVADAKDAKLESSKKKDSDAKYYLYVQGDEIFGDTLTLQCNEEQFPFLDKRDGPFKGFSVEENYQHGICQGYNNGSLSHCGKFESVRFKFYDNLSNKVMSFFNKYSEGLRDIVICIRYDNVIKEYKFASLYIASDSARLILTVRKT